LACELILTIPIISKETDSENEHDLLPENAISKDIMTLLSTMASSSAQNENSIYGKSSKYSLIKKKQKHQLVKIRKIMRK